MKTIPVWSLLLGSIFAFLAFTSCGKDEILDESGSIEEKTIVGFWKQNNTGEKVITCGFDRHEGCTFSEKYSERGEVNVASYGTTMVSYDQKMISRYGQYAIENGRVMIAYNYYVTDYFCEGKRVYVQGENYDESNPPTESHSYSVRGNTMTIGDDTWSKTAELR